ncbi:MAG: GTP-binding protein [Desulfuromonadales bacterium]|nr:MAG: GTP-binding protein [Desulfuromonadales bacterium]
MALFNRTKREINAKIVYFGPSFAGKTTSLQFIHRKLKPDHRGAIKTMGGQKDRMLFFDFMPPELGEVNGFRVRFHLYTVQGEVTSPSTWKTVLKGADGVVFVADASGERVSAAGENLQRLREYLQSYGQEFQDVPIVLQCSKSDLPGALTPEEMAKHLDAAGMAAVRASAKTGEGVLQALSSVVKQVLKRLREQEPEEETLDGQEDAGTVAPSVSLDQTEEQEGAVPAVSADTLASPVAGAIAAPVGTVGEPDLAIAGPAEMTPDGRCCVPLAIRCGERERRYVLTVFLTAEDHHDN